MNVMMLAAGEGQRLRPFTNVYPKPLIPFLGIPLFQFSLELLQNHPIQKLVFNLFYKKDEAKKGFEAQINRHPIGGSAFFSEEPILLGSGGGLKNAEPYFLKNRSDLLVVMNADELIIADDDLITQLIQEHLKEPDRLATLLCVENAYAGSRFGGVWVDEKFYIQDFGKSFSNNLAPLHFTGIYCFHPSILSLIPNATEPSNLIYDVLIKQLSSQRVRAFLSKAQWFETGSWDDYLKASEAAIYLLKNKNLFLIQALKKHWREDWYFIENSLVAKSAILPNHIQLKGLNVIPPHCDLSLCNSIENVFLLPQMKLKGIVAHQIGEGTLS